MAKKQPYVTVRRVVANHLVFEPNTAFPGDEFPDPQLKPEQIEALLECGAIREPDAPPRPAPVLPKLGDEEMVSGDARHMSRNG